MLAVDHIIEGGQFAGHSSQIVGHSIRKLTKYYEKPN